MKINIALGRKLATKDIFYHGTSSKFLRSILKNGLLPKTKEGVWKEEDSIVNISIPTELSRQSFDGIYLTTTLRLAVRYASASARKFNSNPLLVCIKGQTRSGYLDEDTLTYNFKQFTRLELQKSTPICMLGDFSHESDAGVKSTVEQGKEILKGPKEYIVSSIERELEMKIPKRALDLIDKILFKLATRSTVINSKVSKYGDYDLRKAIDAVDKEVENRIVETIMSSDPEKLEREYRFYMDQLTRTLRSSIPKLKGRLSHTFRVVQPITYRGANKIVCILEEEDSDLYVRYGHPPSGMEESIKQEWKENFSFIFK